jgi:hypothetical protein
VNLFAVATSARSGAGRSSRPWTGARRDVLRVLHGVRRALLDAYDSGDAGASWHGDVPLRHRHNQRPADASCCARRSCRRRSSGSLLGPAGDPFPTATACAARGGATGLSGSRRNVGSSGRDRPGPGIVAYSQTHFPASSHIQAGETWNFQCFYRDPTGPCGATVNTTNGFSVTFTP